MPWWLVASAAWAAPVAVSDTIEAALDKLEAGDDLGARELFASALPDLETAATADPKNAEVHFLLGQARYYTGADVPAEASFRRALELQADHEGAMNAIAMLLSERGEWMAAAEAWADLAETHPKNEVALWNQGQALQLAGENKASRAIFTAIAEREPQEWKALAKIVQLAQAEGDLAGRDAALARLRELREGGTITSLSEAGLFVRDQFEAWGKGVMVLEYFELQGEMAKIYVFALRDLATGDELGSISLGSYEATTRFARETGTIGPEDRMYHLDGYWIDGSHSTFGFLEARPSYDETKALVLEILHGPVQSLASTSPDGSVERMLPMPGKHDKREQRRARRKEKALQDE